MYVSSCILCRRSNRPCCCRLQGAAIYAPLVAVSSLRRLGEAPLSSFAFGFIQQAFGRSAAAARSRLSVISAARTGLVVIARKVKHRHRCTRRPPFGFIQQAFGRSTAAARSRRSVVTRNARPIYRHFVSAGRHQSVVVGGVLRKGSSCEFLNFWRWAEAEVSRRCGGELSD